MPVTSRQTQQHIKYWKILLIGKRNDKKTKNCYERFNKN